MGCFAHIQLWGSGSVRCIVNSWKTFSLWRGTLRSRVCWSNAVWDHEGWYVRFAHFDEVSVLVILLTLKHIETIQFCWTSPLPGGLCQTIWEVHHGRPGREERFTRCFQKCRTNSSPQVAEQAKVVNEYEQQVRLQGDQKNRSTPPSQEQRRWKRSKTQQRDEYCVSQNENMDQWSPGSASSSAHLSVAVREPGQLCEKTLKAETSFRAFGASWWPSAFKTQSWQAAIANISAGAEAKSKACSWCYRPSTRFFVGMLGSCS